ncbi:hypothetical protein BDY21DRAFT_351104 [Lineolata rhizophorae]|uniref:Uncharacterized protein n=1 Tax=Lineolata rhizophorae TaxID=578093 RepID=A0A6A6NUA9_9PEZI|nr:hypothetical protein BDY21DRAFT_351104 [Lineolata rhizophorae]
MTSPNPKQIPLPSPSSQIASYRLHEGNSSGADSITASQAGSGHASSNKSKKRKGIRRLAVWNHGPVVSSSSSEKSKSSATKKRKPGGVLRRFSSRSSSSRTQKTSTGSSSLSAVAMQALRGGERSPDLRMLDLADAYDRADRKRDVQREDVQRLEDKDTPPMELELFDSNEKSVPRSPQRPSPHPIQGSSNSKTSCPARRLRSSVSSVKGAIESRRNSRAESRRCSLTTLEKLEITQVNLQDSLSGEHASPEGETPGGLSTPETLTQTPKLDKKEDGRASLAKSRISSFHQPMPSIKSLSIRKGSSSQNTPASSEVLGESYCTAEVRRGYERNEHNSDDSPRPSTNTNLHDTNSVAGSFETALTGRGRARSKSVRPRWLRLSHSSSKSDVSSVHSAREYTRKSSSATKEQATHHASPTGKSPEEKSETGSRKESSSRGKSKLSGLGKLESTNKYFAPPEGEIQRVSTPPLPKEGRSYGFFFDYRAPYGTGPVARPQPRPESPVDPVLQLETRRRSSNDDSYFHKRLEMILAEPDDDYRTDVAKYVEVNVPEHLENSPLCPLHPVNKPGRGLCPYHGRGRDDPPERRGRARKRNMSTPDAETADMMTKGLNTDGSEATELTEYLMHESFCPSYPGRDRTPAASEREVLNAAWPLLTDCALEEPSPKDYENDGAWMVLF